MANSFRFNLHHSDAKVEVSPSLGIRVFDAQGQEILVLEPSPTLYRHLAFSLLDEMRRRGW